MKVSGKVPKGEAIYCESLAFSGKYDLDYGSTVSISSYPKVQVSRTDSV